MTSDIERAGPDDVRDVLRLLNQSGLPLDGLTDHLGTTLVARRDGLIVGCIALEVYPGAALLRSVAVAPEWQGHGLGRELTAAALALARDLELPAVFLLTTTADGYFPKFGFEPVSRSEVPESVQTSVEFTTACPSSAIVMRKTLAREAIHG